MNLTNVWLFRSTIVKIRNEEMKIKLHTAGLGGCALAVTLLLAAGTAGAQVLQATIQAESRINTQAQASQQRIDNLAEQTNQLLTEYRKVVSETEALKIYNDQLEKIVVGQRNTIASINRQLAELDDTNREVVPLMLEMIDALDKLVRSDVPFRLDERRDLVNSLRLDMDDPNVSTSEKYRKILETYQTELQYGRTAEAYSGSLPDGQQVDFLRVGRVLLIYQTLDGETSGWWNPQSRQFETLGGEYRLPIREGLAIASNQRAPDLVKLPVPAPVSAQ